VAIARALAMQPIALLCDEITSAIDPELVAEVLAVVKELAAEGMTLVMVTHEMRFARDVCSRVVFMQQGRVHEIGPPEEVFASPMTPELRQFLGTS
jgi:polar amino acid transport system ATP-binding protein